MKFAFIAIIVLFIAITSAQAGSAAMAFGVSSTVKHRASTELGVHVWISNLVEFLALAGATPVPKIYTNMLDQEMYDLVGTLGFDFIFRPEDRSIWALLIGVHTEHMVTRNRYLMEWEYRNSHLLGEVGLSLYFVENWAIAGLYRTGIKFPYKNSSEEFSQEKQVSLRLYCWVI